MLVFLNRSKRSDPHLEWKVRIFAVAAVLGLCGIYFDDRWMTGGAIVLLAGAIFLRFLPGAGRVPADELDGDDGNG
jgi:hypothetical protein